MWYIYDVSAAQSQGQIFPVIDYHLNIITKTDTNIRGHEIKIYGKEEIH